MYFPNQPWNGLLAKLATNNSSHPTHACHSPHLKRWELIHYQHHPESRLSFWFALTNRMSPKWCCDYSVSRPSVSWQLWLHPQGSHLHVKKSMFSAEEKGNVEREIRHRGQETAKRQRERPSHPSHPRWRARHVSGATLESLAPCELLQTMSCWAEQRWAIPIKSCPHCRIMSK